MPSRLERSLFVRGDWPLRILVLKFGGTSVATPSLRTKACEHVIEAKKAGFSPVVVVSAMGRRGEPYATDTLLDILGQVGPEVDPREQDLMLSCGEVISSVVFSKTLRVMGHPAVSLTGAQAGIITDDNFGNTRIVEVRPDRLMELLREGKIPVVAGFQGVTRSGEITTLGRGGSDTTACALAAALNAEAVEIYTDVDGIMTADPKFVPDARPIRVITYREVSEMAHLGAKVIHPRAAEIAMAHKIPLRIRSTSSDAPGTLVTDNVGGFDAVTVRADRVVTGVAHIADIAQIKIRGSDDFNKTGRALAVFGALGSAGISIDIINFFPDLICFTVQEGVLDRAVEVIKGIDLGDAEVTTMRGCAKVSVVGGGMRGVPGVMALVVAALHEADVEIYQTADSHTSISCLVKKEDMQKAMMSLHQKFGLGS